MHRIVALFAVVVAWLLAVSPVQAQAPTPTPAPPSIVGYIVNADVANLRSGPSTDARIVDTASKGDRLLIYDEAPGTQGWLRVFRVGEADVYIADFLVERAPITFYPIDQEPLFVVSGRAAQASEVLQLPYGGYRIDATVYDVSFKLRIRVVDGYCDDVTLFNELDFEATRMTMSDAFVSMSCSVVFETENVDGEWRIEVRDLIVDDAFLIANTLKIEDGTVIRGEGHQLTMSTALPMGSWMVTAKVDHNMFILWSYVMMGECDSGAVFNELDTDAEAIEVSAVYRSPKPGCMMYWQTDNVNGEWSLTFTRLQ
ncbi:MAG: SH3 domain-containing protein [Anaerolineae bacterium]|nr:SH3 domain-containing protein [Anaerolineae bacterium]